MNANEKKEFISSLLNAVKEKLVKNIDKYPESWDGLELRWLIMDHVNESVVFGSGLDKKSRRYKEYRNTVLVENL